MNNGEWRRDQTIIASGGVRINADVVISTENRNTEKEDQVLFSDIIRRSQKKHSTLGSALGYYSSAFLGIDQLAIAANLYMAMEELLAKFNTGKKKRDWDWKEITKELEPINPRLTNSYLFNLKQVHRGRHTVDDNGKPNIPLTTQELKKFKDAVRLYILTYVEWLKENK
ncbi:hypothetical protein GF359_03000 [candidate division WOR-3 bacterium]|uniref:Uncharacterized protein n=1 Tax=candidate division WOR-3 bacterium TaxID=2052148 RepID=A0A9D5K8B2_UNCW3|nr:hypothetical protein [candidate division WOR-3 bacterium]MBD3364162.1 hypothetical protein [candidate division WOR-3 bacterium]